MAVGQSGALVVTFAKGGLAGKSIILDPLVQDDGTIEWQCASENVPQSHLPKGCIVE